MLDQPLAMSRRPLARPARVAAAVALLAAAASDARAAETPPSVYVMALPARVAFIAVLPVPTASDLYDLDLRPEVVLPQDCGDRLAGLLRHGGPRFDGEDAWDVVLERRQQIGDCKKNAVRLGSRWAIRVRVPDNGTRQLDIGSLVLQVARRGETITIDGQGPEGDVPGAPPTAAPATLVLGDVKAAALKSSSLIAGHAAAIATFDVTARWPRCAREPLGMLGRGDLASGFLLHHFTPLAVAPLDGSCKGEPVARKSALRTTVRLAGRATEARVHVGEVSLLVSGGRPATAAPIAPTPAATAKPGGARP